MNIIKGGVTAPKGFLASGVKAGIKKSGRLDFGLLYSEVPAFAAASFTKNRFQASPVKVSKKYLGNKTHQAVVVNSGNANCANGKIGDKDAANMAKLVGEGLLLGDKEVLVASTGIIGHYLPIEKIESAVPELVACLSAANGSIFAQAIMTTDTVKKELAVRVKLGSATVTIGGACKGVGMLYPDMKTQMHATMLSFISTDALITKKMLARSLDEAIADSFNMVSVDGDMSTNDSCFILANGLAKNRCIKSNGKDYDKFTTALKYLCKELAKLLAVDGEGATKFIEIRVVGAKSVDDARKIARKISTSNLLKCAVCGEDPNWGRVVAAAGAGGVDFDPDKADVYLGNMKALLNGQSIKNFDRAKAQKIFQKKKVYITVDLKSGKAGATAWTCDFSKEYVVINSEYST
ncbi:MAG: bifunctional glutamate N-acetyltransferase/amino-acid acetyltransferase ArgJ [Candidatus Omnitrophota bacterium]|nr:bifunctional glutamate N-acetyltransferase/amino-acid acetyltransferase ArgJ [Candidatus Omnitrophota bacterium]